MLDRLQKQVRRAANSTLAACLKDLDDRRMWPISFRFIGNGIHNCFEDFHLNLLNQLLFLILVRRLLVILKCFLIFLMILWDVYASNFLSPTAIAKLL